MGNPKYTRLDEEDEDTDSQPNVSISNKKTATALKWSIVANCVLALAAFGSTTFLLRDYGLRKHQDVSACDIQWYNIVQDVSRAPETEIKPYYYLEDGFDDDDFGLGDPYWRSLFPKGDGVVYLSDEITNALRLPATIRDPWRGNTSMYMMAGWHSLHCVTSLRQILGRTMRAQRTSTTYTIDDEDWNHAKHCLSDARQQLLCHFDEQLYPAHDFRRHPGNLEPKVCKRLEPVTKWTEDHWMVGVEPPGFDLQKWKEEHHDEAFVDG